MYLPSESYCSEMTKLIVPQPSRAKRHGNQEALVFKYFNGLEE